MRKNIPLWFISAIRDIASDNKVWRRSPLRQLLEFTNITPEQLEPYAHEIKLISDRVVHEQEALKNLEAEIQERLKLMIGGLHTIETQLGLNATTPQALLEALRLYVDGTHRRSLERTSLGLQNVLFLSLIGLLLKKQKINHSGIEEPFIPIIALEEPEAHLHPHLQRLVFKDFLNEAQERKQPVLISTHSPHLISATSLSDLVVLKDEGSKGCQAKSAYNLMQQLDLRAKRDLERFLDITKAEMLLAKGVIFVEGDVEVLLVAEFAEILDKSLDQYGISICNVYGVHFEHVIKLAYHLDIPFAILTDGDKFCPTTGLQRGIRLVEIIQASVGTRLQNAYDENRYGVVGRYLQWVGIFVNEWTLEISLLDSGLAEQLKLTFLELGDESLCVTIE